MVGVVSLLLGLSLFVRSFQLSLVPPELFGDEIDVGYQAFSLLQTGKDLYAQSLPVYVHSLSEWRAPLLMYATVPAIAWLGLTPVAVRLPEVIFGSLAPLLLLGLSRTSGISRRAAFAAALILALSPWHILFSRAAFEAVILLDLILIASWCFYRRRDFLAGLFFALALYTYSTAILFLFLILPVLIIFVRRRWSWPMFLTFITVALPVLWTVLVGHAADRFGLLSIFSSPQVMDHARTMRLLDLGWGVFWHNRWLTWFDTILANYLQAFSFTFLFVRGDPTFRHSLQVIGQFLPSTAPLLVLGCSKFFTARYRFWWLWLLIAPIPASLTLDGAFHATRLFILLAPLSVLMGLGWSRLKKPGLRIVFAGLFLIQLAQAGHYYLVHYPNESSRWWQVGYQQAFSLISNLSPSYSRIYINNTYEPALIRFLFYTRFSPADFHRLFMGDWDSRQLTTYYRGFNFAGRWNFGTFTPAASSVAFSDRLIPGSLYLISQRDEVGGDWDWRSQPPAGVRIIKTITDLNNAPLFYLVDKL